MIAFIILLLISVVFGKNIRETERSKKCGLELDGIVYSPESCGLEYLRRISRELQIKSPLLFSVQNYTVIQEFSQTYHVSVILVDAFGHIMTASGQTITDGFRTVYGPINPNVASQFAAVIAFINSKGLPIASFSAAQARVNLIGEGGVTGERHFLTATDVFAFSIWSQAGEMYTVFLYIEQSNSPIFCR